MHGHIGVEDPGLIWTFEIVQLVIDIKRRIMLSLVLFRLLQGIGFVTDNIS